MKNIRLYKSKIGSWLYSLNENFGVAMGRLQNFWKIASENPAFLQKYHDDMLEREDKGVIEEVTDSQFITCLIMRC